MSSFEPGSILAGKYRIERVLGQGGMGAVVAARHLQLDEEVAIKFLLPEVLGNREVVARFEREARAAVKIKSEHTVRVSDVGTLESGAAYMVMELLRGRDLGQVLQDRGPLPLDEASDYLLQACEAIAEAHGVGIVHRDLKPANLFLTQRADGSPCVKVIDFGISKVTNAGGSDADQSMTRTKAIMGSPLYMSPEQLLSARDVDMRTDVWAIGVIFYEMLTATTPFTADTLPQLCTQIMASPPIPIRNYLPDVPTGVEHLILRCLEKDRGKRVATVAEFALQLAPHAPKRSRVSIERIDRLSRAAGFSGSALAMPPSSSEVPLASQTVTGFVKTGSRDALSRKWVIAVAAGAVALGLVAALTASSRNPEMPKVEHGSVSPPSAPAAAQPELAPRVAPVESVVASFPASTPSSIASGAKPQETKPAMARPPVAATPKPQRGGTARPPPAAEPPSPAAELPKPKPHCDPNFYFDTDGHKHFKPECF